MSSWALERTCVHYLMILSRDLCNSIAYFHCLSLGLLIKTTWFMSNNEIRIVPNMKPCHATWVNEARAIWTDSRKDRRVACIVRSCGGASGCFSTSETVTYLSRSHGKFGCVSYQRALIPGKAVVKGRGGGGKWVFAAGLQIIWTPTGCFSASRQNSKHKHPTSFVVSIHHLPLKKKKKRLKKMFHVWLQWQRAGANSSLDGFLSHPLSENS